MPVYDIFNGDADGLCALQQLRLLQPCDSVLVTGAKREIALLGRVAAAAGDHCTVLDLALPPNRAALERLLAAGARCLYVDHHEPGERPAHPALELHVDTRADTCTSLLVDALTGGHHRAWAVTAAFGDGMPDTARRAAAPLGLADADLRQLRDLGEALNHNAYGATADELAFHPAWLHRRMRDWDDPLAFVRHDEVAGRLCAALHADLAQAAGVVPRLDTPRHRLLLLPPQPWSRRVAGVLAHRLAEAAPDQAQAVLVPVEGGYVVSVRAPRADEGAAAFCRAFGGGGRAAAGGIPHLPATQQAAFEAAFLAAFARPGPTSP